MKPISSSLKEYLRGISGGSLFSLPLFYTQEMWEAGFNISPLLLLIYMASIMVLLLGYNWHSGVHNARNWNAVVLESFEEAGIGLFCAFFILWLLRIIDPIAMGWQEVTGKTVIQGMALAIGVSVGTGQLGMDNENKGSHEGSAVLPFRPGKYYLGKKLWLVIMAICAGILIGLNIAPTSEVVILSLRSGPSLILAILLISLGLTAGVLYFSDFKGGFAKNASGSWYDIIFDTCITYLAALLSSAFMLWFFGRFTHNSFQVDLFQTILLGFATTLGASAGRLLIK